MNALPARNGLIAKIHIAKSKLAVEDESYRALLMRVTGKESCKLMNEAELERVLAEFNRLGFRGIKRRGPIAKVDDAQASKIRALWLDLYHFGEIRDPSEQALAKYVSRMSGVRAIQWLNPVKADAVIKGLRGWLERVGFRHPTSEETKVLNYLRFQRMEQVEDVTFGFSEATKIFVIRHQLKLLGKDNNEIYQATFTKHEHLDRTIEMLGRLVRARKADA